MAATRTLGSLAQATRCARPINCISRSTPAGPSRLRFQRHLTISSIRSAEVQPGPALSPSNRAEITLRRFWKTVNIEENTEAAGGYLIKLDHRNLKTPDGTLLVIPSDKRIFAALIAAEWENQSEALKPTSLSLTSLASRAIDGLTSDLARKPVIDKLMRYLETDTILFFDNDGSGVLEKMQKQHWDPLLKWVSEEYGVTLNLAEGFSPAKQSPETIEKLRAVVDQMDPWQLAAFERAAYASKSFIIALALIKGRLSADQAADAAHVEVRSQIDHWGEVEDSHDVDYQDIRRSLGSVAVLLAQTH